MMAAAISTRMSTMRAHQESGSRAPRSSVAVMGRVRSSPAEPGAAPTGWSSNDVALLSLRMRSILVGGRWRVRVGEHLDVDHELADAEDGKRQRKRDDVIEQAEQQQPCQQVLPVEL